MNHIIDVKVILDVTGQMLTVRESKTHLEGSEATLGQ